MGCRGSSIRVAPGPIRHNYYGFPDENYLKTNDDILTAKVSHAFGENVSLHSIARWANYPRQAKITEPQICSNDSDERAGGRSCRFAADQLGQSGASRARIRRRRDPATIEVNRNQLQIKSVEGDLWDQTELTARFKVLGMRQ